MKKLTCVVLIVSSVLSGCSSISSKIVERKEVVEYYHIFDIQTDQNGLAVAESASKGLAKNVTDAEEFRPIPDGSPLPEKAGRFKIINPLKGSALSGMAYSPGASIKIVTCEGASWSAKAERKTSDSKLKITACLFPYKQGYHLNMYAKFSKKEGGFGELTRYVTDGIIGSAEEWTEKTFLDVIRQIESDNESTKVSLIEGYPTLKSQSFIQ